MIRGTVSDGLQPVITLIVRGPGGAEYQFDAQVDTGFSGGLTLPPDIVARLGLAWLRSDLTTLADGSEVEYNVHLGVVVWDGQPRTVGIDASEVEPLVGTELLAGCRPTADFQPGGRVTVARVPRPPSPATVRGIRV